MAAIVFLTMHLARALGEIVLSRLSALILASMALVFLALVSLGKTKPWLWLFLAGLADNR